MRTFIYLFLVTSLVIVNWSVYAQTSKFNLGVIGGPSYSFDYTKKNRDYATYRLLYTVGLTAQAKLNDRVSLTTNLLLEQRGERLEGGIFGGTIAPGSSRIGEAVSTENYITIPIMCTYSFGKHNRFSVSAGPYISYFFLSKYELKSEGKTTSSNKATDLYKPLSGGLSVNMGTTFPIANQLNAHIFIRNNLGLISYREDVNTIQLLLGVTYHFKQ